MLINKLFSRKNLSSFNLLIILLLLIGSAAFPNSVLADSVMTVTTSVDEQNTNGSCSLREAIINANTNSTSGSADCAAGSGNDTIQFDGALGAATIILASTLPSITDVNNLTINGGGDITISGNDQYRILLVNSSITLDHLTLSNGRCGSCSGGGIYSSGGTVIITNSTLSDNDNSGIYIYQGLLHITNSTFSNNTSVYGGAISVFSFTDSEGTAVITNSTFLGNTSEPGGGGSSVYAYGNVTITNTVFMDNVSDRGAIYNNGMMTITDSIFLGNSAMAGGGGGIYNTNNEFLLTIKNSTFSENNAINGTGGGLSNMDGNVLITNSTFSGNTAAAGGGIFNADTATLTVANSTFSGNSVSGNGGGIYAFGILHLQNSILANSIGDEDCYNVSGNTIATNINNLIETNGVSEHMCGTPSITVDPNLGTLTGSPAYFPLSNSSPAIDAGDDAVCDASPVSNTSQNGVTRPQGDHCDIGAYEVDNIPAVTSSVRASTNPTSASNVDFTVTFSEPVIGVDPSDFSLATTGVSSAAVSGISGSGSVYTVAVNTGVGSGTLRLDVLDNDSITDLSLNPLSAGLTTGETYTISKTPIFTDVPYSYWANSYIERLYTASITGGCVLSPLQYCPDSTVTRAQMAIFLLKGIHGSSYTPPAVNGNTGFSDVAADYWAAAWIKQLAAEGITSGCGAGIYCPESTVTRAQMAIFLLKAKHGSSYSPSAATGVFTDVPVGYWADKWIERLAVEGVTSGCGNGNYCPEDSVTRAQMGVFLVKAFGLP